MQSVEPKTSGWFNSLRDSEGVAADPSAEQGASDERGQAA